MQCQHHHHEDHATCIKHVPIFASLSNKENMELVEISSSRSFKKGETIYRAGDEGELFSSSTLDEQNFIA